MIVGLKAVFNIKDQLTTLGYEDLRGPFPFTATQDSFVYGCLKEKYTVISSTNTPFCVGDFDDRYVIEGLTVGGSSSGAVLDLLHKTIDVAVTTDTGNSTIWPAARHNLYGFKPTYGVISRQGLVPLCSRLDTVSLMAQTPENIKSIYVELIKKDPSDLTQQLNLNEALNPDVSEDTCKGNSWNIPENLFSPTDLQQLKRLYPQAKLTKLHFPENIGLILEGAYNYVLTPEFFSNMCKFNELFQSRQYFKNIKNKYDLQKIIRVRTQYFSKEIQRRILLGAYLLDPKNTPVTYNYEKYEKLKQYLNDQLGSSRWILPIVDGKTDCFKNTYDLGSGPYWPLLANFTGRPSAVIRSKSGSDLRYYLLCPVYEDTFLLNFLEKV